jgi:hypothetical protein
MSVRRAEINHCFEMFPRPAKPREHAPKRILFFGLNYLSGDLVVQKSLLHELHMALVLF